MATPGDGEWQARVDLAALYRLVDLYGWSDLLGTHISHRVPGEPDRFLLNPYGFLWEEMTASRIELEALYFASPESEREQAAHAYWKAQATRLRADGAIPFAPS